MFSNRVSKERQKKSRETKDLVLAYDELSHEGFAVWIRLLMADSAQLEAGRGELARMLGYSEGRSNAVLRELRAKRYITITPSKRVGLPTTIAINKHGLIGRRSAVVTLRNTLLDDAPEPSNDNDWLDDITSGIPKPIVQREPIDEQSMERDGFMYAISRSVSDPRKTPVASKAPMLSKKLQDLADEEELSNFYDELMGKNGSGVFARTPEKTANGAKKHTAPAAKASTGMSSASKLIATHKTKPANDAQLKGARVETSHGKVPGQSLLGKVGLNLDRFRAKGKKERRAERSRAKQTAPVHPDVGKPIDWTRWDLNDKPLISFDPNDSEYEKMVAIIQSDPRRISAADRNVRKELIAKLRAEFIRGYERYRRAALRADGARTTLYCVLPEEMKYAERAAIACVIKGVTPSQVLEYWHDNIGNFADAKMPVPPLPFLSQPANIDAVSIGLLAKAKNKDLPPRAREGKRDLSQHPMSDTSLLHPLLRRLLMDKGFDLSAINDKYLVQIQAYAIDVAHGAQEIAYIPRAVRAMTKVAAAEIYKHVNPYDYL